MRMAAVENKYPKNQLIRVLEPVQQEKLILRRGSMKI
jgi:hypothetical protein